MIINSEIANLQNSPGIQANTAANKPLAADVAIGTIYVSTDTGTIERSNGTTWLNLGGGSGTTPGIDDVLSVNQPLLSNQTIDTTGFNLELLSILGTPMIFFGGTSQIAKFGNQGGFTLDIDCANNSPKIYFSDQNVFRARHVNKIVELGDYIGTGAGFVVNGMNNAISASYNNASNGFFLDFVNWDFYIGDNANQNNGNTIYIDDQQNTIVYKNNGNTDGLSFDMANQVYDIGNLTTNLTGFRIDDGNKKITGQSTNGIDGINLNFQNLQFDFGGIDNTFTNDFYLKINQFGNQASMIVNGAGNGLILDFTNRNFLFGDYAGIYNATRLELSDSTTTATLKAATETIIDTAKLNFPDPNIETTSSSGNSGNHLKVTVNGVDYVIKLENP